MSETAQARAVAAEQQFGPHERSLVIEAPKKGRWIGPTVLVVGIALIPISVVAIDNLNSTSPLMTLMFFVFIAGGAMVLTGIMLWIWMAMRSSAGDIAVHLYREGFVWTTAKQQAGFPWAHTRVQVEDEEYSAEGISVIRRRWLIDNGSEQVQFDEKLFGRIAVEIGETIAARAAHR